MNVGLHIALFFGGAFLLNALPHLVAGVMGEPFQSPFATPRGEGRSSSTVNLLWGFANLVVAWLLLVHVWRLDIADPGQVLATGLGALAIGLFAARHFGRFNGGNTPR